MNDHASVGSQKMYMLLVAYISLFNAGLVFRRDASGDRDHRKWAVVLVMRWAGVVVVVVGGEGGVIPTAALSPPTRFDIKTELR